MKRNWTMWLILASLAACKAGTPTEATKASGSLPGKKGEGGVQIMTADDIKKLEAERPEMMRRASPLGEEKDPVEALRKQASGK
ncbi:MAG: hypothetical protein HY847_07645 [Betaproteobacteria bacterium]|nr:hypothetical protein [Betaproteobacteria bacterium]